MDITPLIPKGRNIINSYSDSGFKISEKDFSGSIFLSPENVQEINLKESDNIEEEKLLSLLTKNTNSRIEILLVGTGKKHLHLSPKIKAEYKKIFPDSSIDEMTTSAACRTFNILTLEDRKVAAILLI